MRRQSCWLGGGRAFAFLRAQGAALAAAAPAPGTVRVHSWSGNLENLCFFFFFKPKVFYINIGFKFLILAPKYFAGLQLGSGFLIKKKEKSEERKDIKWLFDFTNT